MQARKKEEKDDWAQLCALSAFSLNDHGIHPNILSRILLED
jgi:hypothetical protein